MSYLKKHWLKIIFLLMPVIIFFLAQRTAKKDDTLKKSGKIAIGVITKIEKGNRARIYFFYEFNDENGILFKNSNEEILNNYNFFLQRSFPVIYDPIDPSNNQILITKDDFESYKVVYPDSLDWVEQYTP
jgi:hypothetical protein